VAKNIDWLYKRKSCETCKKADGYMLGAGTTVKETVDAAKNRFSKDDILKLLGTVDRVIAMRGKKVNVLDLRKDKPDEETLFAQLIGPTGNLRAPTARVGKTLLVGLNEDAYKQVLGG
jgi:arsenate reductase-like glutaredoxin family protein